MILVRRRKPDLLEKTRKDTWEHAEHTERVWAQVVKMLKIYEGKISYKLRKKAEQKVTVIHFSEMFHGQMRGSCGRDTGITD